MQPFPPTTDLHSNPNFWFKPGATLKVSVYKDKNKSEAFGPGLADAHKDEGALLGRGELVLGSEVFVDSEAVNLDPYKRKVKLEQWRQRFESIGKCIE